MRRGEPQRRRRTPDPLVPYEDAWPKQKTMKIVSSNDIDALTEEGEGLALAVFLIFGGRRLLAAICAVLRQ